MLNAADFDGRKNMLNKDIDAVKGAAQSLELQALDVKRNWVKYYEKTLKELKDRCEYNDNTWVREEIEKCKKATAKALDNGIMSEIQKLQK